MPAILLLAAVISASLPQGGVLPDERAAYDTMLADQVRAANRTFTGATCDGAKIEVVSIEPVRIESGPGAIAWREKVRVTGCGHIATENVNIGRMGGAPPWRMTTGLPGASIANMPLQGSTWPAAIGQVRTGPWAGCQSITLDDIYVAARLGNVDFVEPGAPNPPPRRGHLAMQLPETLRPMLDKLDVSEAWMEVWPFTACGHDRTLGVVFIPLKDHSASAYLFLPIWEQIEAHGPGARPAAVADDN